jgi:hypothetical protein
MSSVYRIFCLSHDPAIVLEEEFRSDTDAEAAITVGLDSHPDCDFLIGRFSYPLIEVGCPNRTRNHAGGVFHPRKTMWVDAIWLKLLYLAQNADEDRIERKLVEEAPILSCWGPERLRRLRHVLEM